ncbi:MAG TPA: Mur ligase family protein, partial [Flavisolibacter sp.]|nr:Mur ligase family protein [Flavisolibacter sp.]
MYPIQQVAEIIGSKNFIRDSSTVIVNIYFDSRRIYTPNSAVFFAIITRQNDGHHFIEDAYDKGIRTFIVSSPGIETKVPDANVLLVKDTLAALQKLAAFHRRNFNIPVIGITGSNGKTIVKEWLYQLLQERYNIIRNPKSYNSQIGVPISVWQITKEHSLGIFEAGISTVGEMKNLSSVIQPTIGVITNIGDAHAVGFQSPEQKLNEKLQLFSNVEVVIGNYALINSRIDKPLFTWSTSGDATLSIKQIEVGRDETKISGLYNNEKLSITIFHTDKASIENAITCWCVLLYLKVPINEMQERFKRLFDVDMRLQLKHGINGTTIINDSYSADFTSLNIALDFLQQQSTGLKKTIILSDFIQSDKPDEKLYKEISDLLQSHSVERLITIGEKINRYLDPGFEFHKRYSNIDEFLQQFLTSEYSNEVILLKGARRFQFERIVQLFDKKKHQTVLEVNLNALAHNLKEYRKLLKADTKVMAMVKAFSYGSGGAEIANVLQYHQVDYLGVAYADEGAELRKAGIQLPIMVMNAEETSFDVIVNSNLQPVIFSFEIFYSFRRFLQKQSIQHYPIHVEL